MSDLLRDLCASEFSDRTDYLDRSHNVRLKRNPKYLCFRCEHAVVLKTETSQHHTIRCHEIGKFVLDTIVECSKFQALGTLDIWALAKLAKVIDNTPDKKVGFNAD